MESALEPRVPADVGNSLLQEALAGVFVGVVVKMVGEAMD